MSSAATKSISGMHRTPRKKLEEHFSAVPARRVALIAGILIRQRRRGEE